MATRARLFANVLLQTCLGVLVGCLGIALVQDIAHARKLGVPLAATSIELLIVDRNLLVAHTIQKRTAHPRGQVLPRRIDTYLEVLADRGEDLGVIVRIAEQAAKDSIGNRFRRILNQRLGIDRFLKAQTVALGAGAIGRVERKIARLQIVNGMSVLRARQRQRVFQQFALGPLGGIAIGQHVHVRIAVSQGSRLLDGLGNTA